jgi:hypothetical protein
MTRTETRCLKSVSSDETDRLLATAAQDTSQVVRAGSFDAISERQTSAALAQTISEAAVQESRSLAPPGGGVEAGGGRRPKRLEPAGMAIELKNVTIDRVR